MADRDIRHYSGGGNGGMAAFLGVILGAVLVVGALVFFAQNWNGGSGGSKVSINVPSAPSNVPSAPSAPSPTAPVGSR